MNRSPEPVVLAVLGVVAVIVIAAAVLAGTGSSIPSWYETLAALLVGGALGAYNPPGNSGAPPA